MARQLILLGSFAAAYLAAAVLGEWLLLVPGGGAAFWPAGGLYMGVLAAVAAIGRS